MRLFVSRRSAAMFALVIGLLFMFFGMAFLFGSLEEISRASVLVSFVFIFASIGCAAMAVKLNKRSLYLFFSTFFLLVGFFSFSFRYEYSSV